MMEKNNKKNYTLKAEPGKILLMSYFLACFSEDLHKCSNAYIQTERVPLVNYHLYLSSIEKGLKAAILSKDIENCNKKFLKDKIMHDLVKVYEEFKNLFPISLFTEEEEKLLVAVNIRYKEKGFEYFDSDMLNQACTKFKDIPKLEDIKKISEKVNQFIISKKYFKEV